MRKHFFLIILLTFCFSSSYCQNVYFNNKYFEAYDFESDGFSVKNTASQSVKVIMSDNQGNIISTLILQKGQPFKFKNDEEFNRLNFNERQFSFIYDYDCYRKDVENINKEIENRLARKNRNEVLKALWKGYLEFSKEYGDDYLLTPSKENAKYLSDITSNIEKIHRFYESHKKGESVEGLIELLEDEIRPDPIEEITNNIDSKQLRTIINELTVLNDYLESDISIDLTPYNERVIKLQKMISTHPFSYLEINYERDIQPIVDPDKDEFTNSQEKCDYEAGPRRFGKDAEYSGCPDKEMIKHKRIRRKSERVLNRVYVNALISIAQPDFVDDSEYSQHISNTSSVFDGGLVLYQFNQGKTKGAFSLDGSYRIGTTYVDKLDSGDKLNLFTDKTTSAGLSYHLATNRYQDKSKLIIQPGAGYLINTNVKSENIVDEEGNDAPADIVRVEEQGRVYAFFNTRFLFNSTSNNSFNYGLLAGARYEQNPTILINENYNYKTAIDGLQFNYPENNLYFHAGVTLAF